MNKHDRMYQRIIEHGANLNAIFNTGIDNVKLCKKLLRLERQAHHATTCLCNTNTIDRLGLTREEERSGRYPKQATEDEQDAFFEKILIKVNKILNFKTQGIPVFINHDPRGYALKIKSEYVKKWNLRIEQDWGGFGIIAPEFDGA
jgi:hypothetical protein